MKMTELQYASLVISLSTLGQVDVSDMDHEELLTLAHLLDQAARNVRRYLLSSEVFGSAGQEAANDERSDR